eukprot:803607-Pleurochrysis_carterae.AAC.4
MAWVMGAIPAMTGCSSLRDEFWTRTIRLARNMCGERYFRLVGSTQNDFKRPAKLTWGISAGLALTIARSRL